MDCCWVNCTGHAAETAHVLVPCCCFHAVGFLEVWDLIARCCCFHAVGSLKVWWLPTQKSMAITSVQSERKMSDAEHR